MLVLTACDDASSDSSDGAAPEPAPKVEFTATATNTTTTRSHNAAYQYVTFDIQSDVEVNVKLVLKEQGQPAPTRQEVLDGAGIYRALKTENKSLFLMYDINSKIKEYREALKASGQGANVLHDATATALTVNATGDGGKKVDAQNVDALLLKQNTAYTLYALQSDGPDTVEVQTLIDLTTREFDGTNSANLPAEGATYPDLGVPVPKLYDAASGNGVESTYTDLILYDSRDAALIIPFFAINVQNMLSIALDNIQVNHERIYRLVEFASGDDVYNFPKNEIIMSLLIPSFSTDGTKYYKTYNNVKYHYGYGLMHNHSDIYNGYLLKTSLNYLSATPQNAYGYELQQDQ